MPTLQRLVLIAPLALVACRRGISPESRPAHRPAPLHDAREVHLAKLRQLTFGGENAEGYFNEAGDKLVFQARGGRTGYDCDQIFELDLPTGATRRLSTGRGRTTCAYYFDGDTRVLYSSTHLAGDRCPPQPDRSHGYVWPLFASYDIFVIDPRDPAGTLRRLTRTPGYDAETTYCKANGRFIFTSLRDGDLELYSMRSDGSDVQRLTQRLGYDGGAFYSADGTKIVWRAWKPEGAKAEADYRALLAQNLVRPSRMELWVADADGGNARQVTDYGKASFAPYFFPDGRRIIFATNLDGPRVFHLYAVDEDGKNRERITYSSRFNSFPMFSPDGKHLVFASNRNNAKPGETNLFLAEWK